MPIQPCWPSIKSLAAAPTPRGRPRSPPPPRTPSADADSGDPTENEDRSGVKVYLAFIGLAKRRPTARQVGRLRLQGLLFASAEQIRAYPDCQARLRDGAHFRHNDRGQPRRGVRRGLEGSAFRGKDGRFHDRRRQKSVRGAACRSGGPRPYRLERGARGGQRVRGPRPPRKSLEALRHNLRRREPPGRQALQGCLARWSFTTTLSPG
jgi:hypothetical protein